METTNRIQYGITINSQEVRQRRRNCFTDAVERIREFVYRIWTRSKDRVRVIPELFNIPSVILPIVGKHNSPAIIRISLASNYSLGLIRDVWANATNCPYRNFQACVKPCKPVYAVENLERFQVDPGITNRAYRAGESPRAQRIISFHPITFDSLIRIIEIDRSRFMPDFAINKICNIDSTNRSPLYFISIEKRV